MFKPVLFSELKNYSAKKFRADLFAGLTVGVVALPLAMAFSIACGFPPSKGIYTAIVAGFLISAFGGSRTQIGGPTGAFIVIIASINTQFGYGGLAIATMLAGIFLILFGVFKMGALIKFIPFPVVTGFTSGIAVVIFSTQLKDILGLNHLEVPAEFLEKLKCIAMNLGDTSFSALGLTVGTVAVIMLCRRYFPKMPAMLIGMLLATVVSVLTGMDVQTIGDSFGELPRQLPVPALPEMAWGDMGKLISPALTIALLAAIESLMSATVADGMTGDRHLPNTELIGQGIGNIGSVFFGGIPATGAIARTATNIRSGGQTPVAGLIHAVTLMLILLIFAPQAKLIPLAALSGIMVVVCINMSEYHVFLRMFKGPKSDSFVMMVTFILTLLIDLVVAVEVGVVLAALLFIRRMAELAEVKEITAEITRADEHADEDPEATHNKLIPEGVAVYEVQGPFFFGAVDQFKDIAFCGLRRGKIKLVVLRLRYVSAIDATGLNVLHDFCEQCNRRNLPLVFSGVQKQPYKAFERDGLVKTLGEENVCRDIDSALVRVKDILAKVEQENC